MGTICVLLGIIIFIVSIFLGCFAGSALTAAWSQVATSLTALPRFSAVQIYIVCVSVCGLIGLLIALNLIMNGMIYNKVKRLPKRKR